MINIFICTVQMRFYSFTHLEKKGEFEEGVGMGNWPNLCQGIYIRR